MHREKKLFDVERHSESVKQRRDASHSGSHATDGPIVDGDTTIRLTRKATRFNPAALVSTSES